MDKKRSRWKMGSLMTLLLFLVFAVCVLAVLLIGADVYKRLVERDQASYDRRTVTSFLMTKVRQADALDMLDIQEYEGQDVLVIAEEIEGSWYETWIYCYDGYVRELFTAAGSGLPLEAGDKVLEAAALDFSWAETPDSDLAEQTDASRQTGKGLLTIDVTTLDGTVQTLTLYLRSGEGGGL